MKRVLGTGVFVAFALGAAWGYIEVLYPLQQLIGESEAVAEGKIEKVDAEKKACIVKVEKALKGKCAYERVRINIGPGVEWHPEAVMKHLVVGAPTVLFYNKERKGMLYVNRFFLQVKADAESAPENTWWNFGHIEIKCNRTYCGPAETLAKHVLAVEAGKTKPQPPDVKIPAITKEAVAALPVWGTAAVEESSLPAPFRRTGP